jgi:hypothetical protein
MEADSEFLKLNNHKRSEINISDSSNGGIVKLPSQYEKPDIIKAILDGIFHYPYGKLPWVKIGFTAFCSVSLCYLATVAGSLNDKKGVVNTPVTERIIQKNEEDSRTQVIKIATMIVLGQPLSFPSAGKFPVLGKEVTITTSGNVVIQDPEIIVIAAKLVEADQRDQLSYLADTTLNQKILIGMRTDGHILSGLTQTQAHEKLLKGFAADRSVALKVNDYSGALRAELNMEQIERLKSGSIPYPNYNPELATLAQSKKTEAERALEAKTPNGIANQILSPNLQFGDGEKLEELLN